MIKRSYVLFISIICCSELTAQTVFHSLEEAWSFAEKHNTTLLNAKSDLTKAKDSRTQSYLAFLPTAGLSGTFTDNTALPTTLVPETLLGLKGDGYKPVRFGQTYIYNGGLTAQMDLVNLQTWFHARIAKDSCALSQASLANNKKMICQQVASGYYGYLLASEAERLSSISVQIADSVYQSIHHKFTEGTAAKQNDDVALLNLDRAQETFITAQYQKAAAQNTLRSVLGLSVTDSICIADVFNDQPSESAQGLFEEDPAVRLAFYQTRISLMALYTARSGIIPNVSLGYFNSSQQSNNDFKPFQGGAPWYPTAYWTVKASWNIFTGGSRWLQTQLTKINHEESMRSYENAQKQSAINDDNLRLSYAKAVALCNKARNVMELSFDNYTHITYRYNTGIASIEDRLNAFSDYINYQNQYLNDLSDMLVQSYNIKIRQKTF